MNDKQLTQPEPIDIPLSRIGQWYGQFRIIKPLADLCLLKSMEKYGQLSPVVVIRAGNNNEYELIDGFKRLRAARGLNQECISARVLDIGPHAGKAAILQLNWAGKSISDIEEAMVVYSLFHEDGLKQVEIAALLGRHKSWICRRISLIEQLSDEVKESIKLGLIKVTIGWKLTRLQRCNQEEVMAVIQKHALSVRQTERLIFALLSCPGSEHQAILRAPEKIIHPGTEEVDKPTDERLSQSGLVLGRKLKSMQEHCVLLIEGLCPQGLAHLTESDLICLSPRIGKSIRVAQQALDSLKKALMASEPKPVQEKKECAIHREHSAKKQT
jgi:ParB/RepB/Spo0J family partition protein